MATKKTLSKKRKKMVYKIANLIIFASIVIVLYIFYPVLKNESGYQIKNTYQKVLNVTDKEEKVFDPTPPNTDFSIVIPKIYTKSVVIANVDPEDKDVFLKALKRGVAHARGTSFPDMPGNTYIFAHSTDSLSNVSAYNAVFYLIGKLQKGDEIFIYYKGEKIVYRVIEKKIVSASDVSYLQNFGNENALTLQTCYPPGTTLKRLVVVAKKEI